MIRDIMHRLNARFPRRVLLWPVAVQGERAAGEIAAAIRGFNALAPGGAVPRPDVLIVARGGGSIEDLMAFNEEIVVRAAAESAIPLISAVGHETDTTLIDFASDRARADADSRCRDGRAGAHRTDRADARSRAPHPARFHARHGDSAAAICGSSRACCRAPISFSRSRASVSIYASERLGMRLRATCRSIAALCRNRGAAAARNASPASIAPGR